MVLNTASDAQVLHTKNRFYIYCLFCFQAFICSLTVFSILYRFRYIFKSMFNAVIQKTIYLSIYAVCELDIKDKKQMQAQMKKCIYWEV